MPRYGLYARKSHDDRKLTERSIGEQVEACREVATSGGLEVAREWEESKSARIPGNRPLWKELVAEVEAGRIDAVLCWHVNRLVRNMEEGGKLVQLFVEGRIVEIRTPHSCHRTGDNILPLVLEAASATQFSIDLKHVVERSTEAKFREGGWNCLAPQGYRNLRDPANAKRGVVERDPERFDAVRRAWDLMLTGAHTVRSVADTLNGPWGYRIRATSNRPSGPLSATGMYQVFRNPFYAGLVRRRGRLVPGAHEAMVTPHEFERVQRILGRRTVSKRASHVHDFTGVMRCAYCGQQVTAERKRLRSGKRWDTYRCSDSYRRCTQRGMSLARVEAAIVGAMERVALEREAAVIALLAVRRALLSGEREVEALVSAQEAARAEREGRLARLADMWMEGLVTDKERYRELERRELKGVEDLTMAIERTRRELDHMRENARRVCEYAAFCRERFLVAPPEKRRALVRALGDGFLFYGREKRIEVAVAPILLEFGRFGRSLRGPLEPSGRGFHNEKGATFRDAVLSGRAESHLLEPLPEGEECADVPELPDSLVQALKGPLFPDLFGLDERACDPPRSG